MDGKNLRGAHRPDGRQTQLVSVVDHTHRLILTQTEVVEGNEIAAFVTALELLPELRGCLVTADALHTQRGHAENAAASGNNISRWIALRSSMKHFHPRHRSRLRQSGDNFSGFHRARISATRQHYAYRRVRAEAQRGDHLRLQAVDRGALLSMIDEVIAKNAAVIAEKGIDRSFSPLMGEVMKALR